MPRHAFRSAMPAPAVAPMLQRQTTLPVPHPSKLNGFGNLLQSVLGWEPKSTTSEERPARSTEPSPTVPVSDWRNKLDADAILAAIWDHKYEGFEEQYNTAKRGMKVDLGRFDGVAEYGIPDSEAKQLLLDEIKRMVQIIQNPDVPLIFSEDRYFTSTSSEGYELLEKLSQTILHAVSICSLDNYCLILQRIQKPSIIKKDRLYADFRRIAKYVQAQETSCWLQDPGEKYSDSNTANGNSDTELLIEASYNLVDYMSAILARLLTESGTGDHWQHNLLGVLATFTTKCKVILLDLETHARICVSKMEDEIAVNPLMAGLFKKDEAESEAESDSEEVEDLAQFESVHKSEKNAYEQALCVKEFGIRIHCEDLWEYLLGSLKPSLNSGFSKNAYEMCTIAYETGLEGFQVLLFQDKDYELMATSQVRFLEIAHSGFKSLIQTIQTLKMANHTSEPPPRQGERVENHRPQPVTRLHYQFPTDMNFHNTHISRSSSADRNSLQGNHLQIAQLNLNKMADVATVTLALTCTSPAIGLAIINLRNLVSITGAIMDRSTVHPRFHENPKFFAAFRLYTSEFPSHLSDNSGDVISVAGGIYRGLFSRDFLISGEPQIPNSTPSGFTDQHIHMRTHPGSRSELLTPANIYDRNAKQLAKLSAEMANWIYDGNSVCVSCPKYVWSVMGAALLLVAGGLIIGFTTGTRVRGVDPFNITTYAWVLAGFLILVCKSLRVENWSWRDFFLCRVRCRSVSELQGVTGFNDQLIITKLLHDEFDGILNTSGPYNSVFKRSVGAGEGFAIDKPLDTRTLLLSGLIMVQVATPDGYGLICLDGRPGSPTYLIKHTNSKNVEYIVCPDIDIALYTNGGVNKCQKRRLQLKRTSSYEWTRVLGIYQNLDTVFV